MLAFVFAFNYYVRREFKENLKLALLGDAKAQYMVGRCYEIGKGTIQDKSKAIAWYTIAAEQGETYAKSKLEELLGKRQK